MRFFKELILGFLSYKTAFVIIKKYNLWWLIIFPALLMLGIYQYGYFLQKHYFTKTINTMNDLNWYLILLFLELSVSIMFMNFSKYLMVGLLSPLLTYLSAKTEKILTGKKYPFSWVQFKNDIVRAVKLVIRNLLWYYLFFSVIFFISKFFWENPKNSPIMFIFFILSSYYYGFSFIDYVNERKKLTVVESILFVRNHIGLVLGIGILYSLMIFLPVDLSYIFFMNTKLPIFEQISYFVIHTFLWILASLSPLLACISASVSMNKLKD